MDNILNFIKNILNNNGRGWTIGKIIKTTILVIVALFALSVILAMFKWAFGIDSDGAHKSEVAAIQKIFDEPEMMLSYIENKVSGANSRSFSEGIAIGSPLTRSVKMMAPEMDIMPIPPLGPTGKNAEDYETREYSATFEKNNIDKTCKKFEDLKPLDYVVFENASKNDTYCSYRFKVELEHEKEIISLIESLDPKDFNANTFTIERSITNNENEIKILKKKLEMLDALLENAQTKYAALRNTGDTTALVQAINNEINLIERITNQKLNVQAQIDRLTNSTGIQKERIDYSQFSISVQERKFINLTQIGESWKIALERFINEISNALQQLTIGLLLFVIKLAKFVIFLSVTVLAVTTTAKFLWKIIKRIWSK